jgi:hypothetical protein
MAAGFLENSRISIDIATSTKIIIAVFFITGFGLIIHQQLQLKMDLITTGCFENKKCAERNHNQALRIINLLVI